MAVIVAKIRLRIFSECPKTSDHKGNATPFKESYNVLILSLLGPRSGWYKKEIGSIGSYRIPLSLKKHQ